ncbi:hypothetical protein EHQ46_03020 [Leptospira yanagawae]|uniref:Lipoprotein n=1 Tax=Leptospira yanagawae TaxID=293069 RepID=A0ABY2M7R8_9LEPT|nr:hypothetical protein [Leptospira yanagawae]TGL24110.1 hypothetical protein EHQ46_03020 [Leptospira yanagawae]
MVSPRFFTILLWVFVLSIDCKRGYSEDIQDCNPIADYYEKGTHYIRRDLVKDDNTLDYKKLMEDTRPQASECYPSNHEVK